MPEIDKFALGVQHKGVRFEIASERDAMRLLLTMVRDGVCSVEDAMGCIRFDERSESEK